MGLLDWLLKPFRKAPPPEREVEVDEAGFFGDAPSPTPASKAPVREVRPASKKAPQAAKPLKVAKAPKAQKAQKAPKPPKSPRPEPPPAPPTSEVLSAEEAERRYGALVRPPPPPPAPPRRAAPRPAPPPPPPAPDPEPAPALDATDLPGEGPPPVVGPDPRELAEAARAEARREAQEQRRLAQLPRYQALLSRADALLAIAEVDPHHLLTAKRTLVEEWRALPPPPEAAREELRGALAQRLDALSARIKVSFDARDEERRVNLEKKRALIAELEQLAAQADLANPGPELARVNAAWREIGPVPKEELEPLRAAYEAARQSVLSRRQQERQRDDRARQEQLEQLGGLVAQAEGLAHARDPQAAAERVKALQASWKTIRPRGAREQQEQLWLRFRAACDAVFQRRDQAREAELSANLARKQAILDRAEALAEGEPPEDPEAVVRKLMNDWRRVGFVPRDAGDALWARFKAACDRLRTPPAVELPQGDASALQHQPFAALARPSVRDEEP